MGALCTPRAGPLLLLAGALLLQEAMTLECHSCVEHSDGGCSPEKMKTISCPANTSVCMETVAAVKWSHGQLLVGKKGCSMGLAGTNDNGVELHGIIAFSQLHHCNSSHCNSQLDIQAMALKPTANESNGVPNGLECYSCHGNETCSPGNTTVVKCYNNYRGCFHGNITIKVGNFLLSRTIKGCAQDEHCTKQMKSNGVVTLLGSCCSGNLCNSDLANKTFFAPNIPRLDVLPGYGANASATATTAVAMATTSTAAALLPDGNEKEDLIRDGVHITEESERRNNQDTKTSEGGKGGTAALNASAWLVLLGAALLL